MRSFKEALQEGYTPQVVEGYGLSYWSFKFGERNEYELCFEPLLYGQQYYVALYKDQLLLTEKVVVKPGK